MIRKIFMYDFMDIAKKIFPFYVMLLVFSLITRVMIFFRMIENLSESMRMTLTSILIMVGTVYFFVFIGTGMMTMFVMVSRYYRSMYGDEGYLTNTLPLETYQLILAKFFNFMLWSFFSWLVVFFSVVFIIPFEKIFSIYGMPDIKEYIDNLQLYKYRWSIVLLIIARILDYCRNILSIFLSAAIANMLKGYKIVIGIISYIVINTMTGFIITVYSIFSLTFFYNEESKKLEELLGYMNIFSQANWGNIVLISLICVTLFFIVNYMHRNKLNLE